MFVCHFKTKSLEERNVNCSLFELHRKNKQTKKKTLCNAAVFSMSSGASGKNPLHKLDSVSSILAISIVTLLLT